MKVISRKQEGKTERAGEELGKTQLFLSSCGKQTGCSLGFSNMLKLKGLVSFHQSSEARSLVKRLIL